MHTRLIHPSAYFLAMSLLVMGFLIRPAAPTRADAGILYVAPGAACIGTPNCFATIQEAVDLASPGTEIWVAGGTYTDMHTYPRVDTTTVGTVTQVAYITKTVTIRGGYDAAFTVHDPEAYMTTLDAQNLGRVFYISGDVSPTIQDLSITGGNAAGQGGYEYYGSYDAGGGVYVYTAHATLVNNHIYNNTSPKDGGGVFLVGSSGLLQGNTVKGNSASSGGGGGVFLYNSNATLRSNHIISNTAEYVGGGLYLFAADAMVTGNTIADNTTNGNGGGVDVASCDPALNANIISGNKARKGAGLVLWYSKSILTNNVIINNQVGEAGSGLWIGGSTPQVYHTTIAGNTGAEGSGVFVTDDGSSSPYYSTVTMTNTILVNQAVGISVNSGSQATLDGVLWHGNTSDSGGAGSIDVTHASSGDPAFDMDGYHLLATSAAIDRGVNAGVLTDIDGQPRSSTPDLGADEFWLPGSIRVIVMPVVVRR